MSESDALLVRPALADVAPLALGGNVFGWTADEATSFRLLDAFVDGGGTMIDTADIYSAWVAGHVGGESETIIGRWLKRDPAKRAKVQIATKVGFLDGEIVDGEYVAALEPAVIAKAAESSLARLGVETIDLYYQHRDNGAVPLADSLGAFDQLRRAGKIAAVGLSNFEPQRIADAVRVSSEQGFAAPAAYQGWYNMMERDRFDGPLRASVIDHGLAMFPFYSLANGFLSGKYRRPGDLAQSVRGSRSKAFVESPRGRAVLDALAQVAAETGQAMAAVAIAWTRAQPGITAPIASATSLTQLEELLAGMHLELTPEQIAALDRASD